MNNIKQYQELIVVETFDSKIYYIPADQYDTFLDNWENNKTVAFSEYEREKTTNIKRTYAKKIDSIENFILSQPRDIQEKLKARRKNKKAKIGKDFESVQEIINYIKDKGL